LARIGDARAQVSAAAWASGADPGFCLIDIDGSLARGRSVSKSILDGVDALHVLVSTAGYGSIVDAVAAHALFLHPATVAQTNGQPLFPVIRDAGRRGQFGWAADGSQVLLDDNSTPTQAFLWASGHGRGRDVQYNHLWGGPRR
jgi:hypothetical protein